jgi:hypothetical protein
MNITTMSSEECEKSLLQEKSIVELLAMPPDAADIDFEPPRLSVIIRIPNL